MSDVLGGLSAESMAKLESIQESRTVSKNSMVFLEGTEGSAVYRLISGAIRLYRVSPDGRTSTIHMVEPGELFAAVVLFERDTYPLSAIAVETSVLASIPRHAFRNLLADTAFRDDFLTSIFSRIRSMSDRLYLLNTTNVEGRLARFLELRHGRSSTIVSDLSKQDTADAIMVRPETLSRALSRLKRSGLLQWRRRTIIVNPSFWDQA